MKRPLLLLLAISSVCLLPLTASAGTRPHYGGTARIQVKETLPSVDVIATKPNSFLRQQLAMLLFDRLVQLDEHGAPQPSLAMSWASDSQHRIWQFRLRPTVSFHDGSPLTAAIVASNIATAEPDWKVTASSSQTVVIETDSPSPNLPAILSSPRFSIYSHDADDTLIGTGAFKIGEFLVNRRLLLAGNDDYWGGRPYLDAVDVQMGNSIREQLIDRRLDRDDVVELGLDQARTLGWTPAGSATQLLAASAASDVYAIYFFRANASLAGNPARPKTLTDEVRIREALALTIDRAAISSVLLQRQGEPALAFLPQWLTGYEFLFPSAVDLDRARKLRVEAARNTAIVIPLAYDAGDSVARAIAERVAVNAREANITVQPFGQTNVSADSLTSTSAQAVLVKLPVQSLDSSAALWQLAKILGGEEQQSAILAATTPETLYAAERDLLQDFRILPIARVPQIFWLSPRIKNWAQPREGGWRMQDVWLESDRPASSGTQR